MGGGEGKILAKDKYLITAVIHQSKFLISSFVTPLSLSSRTSLPRGLPRSFPAFAQHLPRQTHVYPRLRIRPRLKWLSRDLRRETGRRATLPLGLTKIVCLIK